MNKIQPLLGMPHFLEKIPHPPKTGPDARGTDLFKPRAEVGPLQRYWRRRARVSFISERETIMSISPCSCRNSAV